MLNQLKFLRENISTELSYSDIEIGIGFIKTLILDRIPRPADLLKRTDIFPARTRLTKHDLRPLPFNQLRKGKYHFKNTFRGIHHMMAIAFAGDCGLKDNLLPRWANFLSTNSVSYVIKKDNEDSCFGVLVIVPVMDSSGGIWGCIEPLSSLLNYRCTQVGENISSTCFVKALEQLNKKLPNTWKGLLVGRAPFVDNYTTLELHSADPVFAKGKVITQKLVLADKQVHDLIQQHKKAAKEYCPIEWQNIPILSCFSSTYNPRVPYLEKSEHE